MSYTYVTTTPVGMVRNLIGDVGPTTFVLTDEEITGMLTMVTSDFFMAAAIACRRIAISQIALAIIRKAGNFSEDKTSIVANYNKMADAYEEYSQNVPVDAQAEVIATDFNYNQLLTDKVHRGEPFDTF